MLQTVNGLGLPRVQPFRVAMEIHGAKGEMELDMGAAMTVMSKRSFEELWVSRAGGVPKLHPTST